MGPGASQMHLPGRVTACECGLGSLVTGKRSLAGFSRYRAVASDPLGISPPPMQVSQTVSGRQSHHQGAKPRSVGNLNGERFIELDLWVFCHDEL